MGHQYIVVDNYRLDYDLSLHIVQQPHKNQDKGFYIFDYYSLHYVHIRSWQHIPADNLVAFLYNQPNMNTQTDHLLDDIDCKDHTAMADMDLSQQRL